MVWIGFATALIAVLGICLVVYLKAAGAYDFAAGLPTVAIMMLFLSGIQLIGMGVLGAYIGAASDDRGEATAEVHRRGDHRPFLA